MPAPTRTSREAWIGAGLTALAGGGPDAVRIDVLARILGVSRGGYYHQFDTRPTFLDQLLDSWERRSTDDVDDVEALALLAFSAAIGNHFVAADHGGRSREQVLRRAVALLFE